MTDARFAAGSIHGRFQPFHNGHLEYLLAALSRCDYLYIGITQFRRRSLVQVESADAIHRANPQSNPLTYFERLRMIASLMASLDVGADRYCVLPFPIEEPAEAVDFLPTDVPVFTTTYDAWNQRKIDVLQGLGYTVVNLWSRSEKAVVGKDVRQLMRDGDARWRELVPPAVAEVLDQLRLGERLKTLEPSSDSP